jgi:hypothetical protein
VTTPAGALIGDATINVNANTAAASLAIRGLTRDANGQLRDMRGRLVSESRLINGALTNATRGSNNFKDALGGLKSAAMLLSPALIPIAVQAAPIAASMGAASVAIGAFAAATAGQVSAINEAAEGEKKYQDAVKEHGAASKQAAEAQAAYARQVQQLPPATRTAAAALSSLKTQYQDWSDSLASSTMPVATKSFQTFSAVFPKLTPLVQGASGQLNRFVTLVAGGIASPGFDRLMRSFADFSTGAMARANDALIRFTRTLNTGQIGGGVAAFLDYARQNGPLVRDTLSKIGEALGNVLQAAANAGPTLLTVVNALAGLVAAVPPGVITAMLQLALALKAVRLAAAGAAAITAGVTGLATAIGAMRTAAAGATGVLPRLSAAIGTLSRTAKVAAIGTGVGVLLIALTELSKLGRQAPPDVDKLTTSLGRLGQSGKASGEGVRLFGKNLSGLYDAVRNISDPTTTDKIQQGLVKVFSLGLADSTPHTEAKEKLDAIDQALTNLVQGGKTDIASAAFQRLAASYRKGGGDVGDLRSKLDGYRSALEDQKFEAQLAAQAQGLFGQQAQETSAKLAHQQTAANGLREAITALNEVNQTAYGAQIQFEGALDSLTESFKENGATLDINTEDGRRNGEAMRAAAKSRDELVTSGIAAGDSLQTMTAKSEKLRSEMMRLALEAFDGNKKKAREYTNELLGTPDSIETLVKLERADAVTGLKAVQTEIAKTPGAKKIVVETLNGAAIAALEAVGLKTKQLPNGKTQVTTRNGQALDSISAVRDALRNLNGKTATTFTYHKVHTTYVSDIVKGSGSLHDALAQGGRVRGYADGGNIQAFPDGGFVQGPGSATSDSILALMGSGARARVSDTEYVVRGAAVRKYGLPLMDAINSMRLPKLAGGAVATGSMAAAGSAVGAGPGASRPALAVGNTRARAAALTGSSVTFQVNLANHGVIGSQMELENWLARAIDNLGRTNRLPRSLRIVT